MRERFVTFFMRERAVRGALAALVLRFRFVTALKGEDLKKRWGGGGGIDIQ